PPIVAPEALFNLINQASHRTDERRQFASLGDDLCTVSTVLAGVGVADRGARRLAPVHPAATVTHRGGSARRLAPCPSSAARAPVHGQVLGCLALHGVVPPFFHDPHPPVAR